MGLIDKLLHREPEEKEVVETPVEVVETPVEVVETPPDWHEEPIEVVDEPVDEKTDEKESVPSFL